MLRRVIATVLLAVASTAVGPIAQVSGAQSVTGFPARDRVAGPDFNGDGYGDLAIGSVESEGADLFRGSVTVLYGTIAGLAATDSQVWTQDSSGILDTSEAGDLFGASLAAGDFDGDGYADLAVGVVGEDFAPGENDAGAVNVLYGSAVGLTADGNQFWAQNSPGIAEDPEPTDSFSQAMAVGDFDGDGYADLAVGVPWEDISFGGDDGAVHVLFGSATGLTSAGSQYWNQDTPGIPETAEPGDLFGSSLAAGNFGNGSQADLAIGVHESVGIFFAAGAVHVLYGSAAGPSAANDQIWNQNRPGVEDGSEEADYFGYSLAAANLGNGSQADLAIGVPYEDVNGQDDAGAVSVLYGTTEGLSATGDQFWHQDSTDVLDVAEAGDRFGYSLATADFGGVTTQDLAIGVPYETIQAPLDEHGAVSVVYGTTTGLTAAGNQLWWQDSTGVNDLAEAGDSFGKTLTARNFGSGARSDLAVGVPLEDVGTAEDAGGVSVLYGTATGLSAAGDQFWTQDSAGIGDAAEFLDEFGRAVVGVT